MTAILKQLAKHLPLLSVLFLLSVLIRLPNLNRPLSKHHEFCTAVVLRVIQTWDASSASDYHFQPIMTYPNVADRHINNFATGLEDSIGNQYYISHAPFAYIVPYFIFRLLSLKPSIIGLQIFHLLVNFICGLLVYLIMLTIADEKKGNASKAALVGFILYMFNPCTLWFQSNVYMSDMFVQPFWFAGVLLFMNMVLHQKENSVVWLGSLFFITYLMTFTEWLGYFFIISIVVFSIIKYRQKKNYLKAALTVILAGCLSLFTTVSIYSSINSIHDYLKSALSRFGERSGYGDMTVLLTIKTFAVNYASNYFPLILLLAVLFFLFKKYKSISFTKQFKYFTFFSLLPVLLHHFIFLNYTGQDLALLKTSLFLSIAPAFFYQELLKYQPPIKKILNTGIVVTVLLMIGLYYFVNQPGQASWKGDRYDLYKRIGEEIKSTSRKDQVLFIEGFEVVPQVNVYAERNILEIQDEQEAKQFLLKYNEKHGKIYVVKNNSIIEQKDIEIK